MSNIELNLSVLFLTLIISLYYNYKNLNNINNNNKCFNIKEELNKRIDKLLSKQSNNKSKQINNQQMQQQQQQQMQQQQMQQQMNGLQGVSNPVLGPLIDIVRSRDNQVVNDDLYPSYGRTERPIFDMLLQNQDRFNSVTRGSPDTFRPVGLAKDKASGEIYNVMGRQKYSGSSLGDFYLTSTNALNKLKINLLNRRGMPLIKDIYNLPRHLKIESGIFHGKEFEIEELPMADLTSSYY